MEICVERERKRKRKRNRKRLRPPTVSAEAIAGSEGGRQRRRDGGENNKSYS